MYLSSRAPPPQHKMYLAITTRPRPLSHRACERAAVDQTTSTSTPPNHAELLSRETERRHPHVNLMTSLSYDIICSQFSPSFGASVRKSSSSSASTLIRLLPVLLFFLPHFCNLGAAPLHNFPSFSSSLARLLVLPLSSISWLIFQH